MIRADEVAECLVFKELELTAKLLIEWEAVSEKAKSPEEAQQKKTAQLERMVEISEEQLAFAKTAPTKNKIRKREEHESSGEETVERATKRRAQRE